MKKFAAILSLCLFAALGFSQTIETETIRQINALRLQMGGSDSGLSPFVRNSALDSAAAYHAKWVVASGIGSHTETKTAAGIKPLAEPWDRSAKYGATSLCENLIQYSIYVRNGSTVDAKATAARVVAAWKKSQGHYDNMMYRFPKQLEARIGIAVVPQEDGSFCIVMIVGANIDQYGNLIK